MWLSAPGLWALMGITSSADHQIVTTAQFLEETAWTPSLWGRAAIGGPPS